jgi:hypothetical protein
MSTSILYQLVLNVVAASCQSEHEPFYGTVNSASVGLWAVPLILQCTKHNCSMALKTTIDTAYRILDYRDYIPLKKPMPASSLIIVSDYLLFEGSVVGPCFVILWTIL